MWVFVIFVLNRGTFYIMPEPKPIIVNTTETNVSKITAHPDCSRKLYYNSLYNPHNFSNHSDSHCLWLGGNC